MTTPIEGSPTEYYRVLHVGVALGPSCNGPKSQRMRKSLLCTGKRPGESGP